MANDSAEWRIEHPLSGPKWTLAVRVVLALMVVALGFRIWDYATGDGELLQLIVSATWVVLLVPALRQQRGWVVRADRDALHLPRPFRTRHIAWSEIKDIRADAAAPWGTVLIVVMQDDQEVPTGLPPDHEGLPKFWNRVSAERNQQ